MSRSYHAVIFIFDTVTFFARHWLTLRQLPTEATKFLQADTSGKCWSGQFGSFDAAAFQLTLPHWLGNNILHCSILNHDWRLEIKGHLYLFLCFTCQPISLPPLIKHWSISEWIEHGSVKSLLLISPLCLHTQSNTLTMYYQEERSLKRRWNALISCLLITQQQ